MIFQRLFMSLKQNLIWIFIAHLLLLTQAVNAVEAQSRSALIIGISHYNGPANDLLGVPADVEMAKQIAKAMDISDSNITVIRDQDATKANVLQTIKAFSQKAANGGRVFIYFSGHGTRYFNPFINSCEEGLLTYDFETISNADMAQATKQLNNSVDKSILLVDTCHSAGVLERPKTRSVLRSDLVAKFASKDKNGEDVCTPVNYKTRSIFDESKTLGAIQENVVFISSARPDEVSWDQPGLGGVATQALKQCLLGGAKDLDGSGAVSLEEVRQCAQVIMDQKVPGPYQVASHVTIRGNRNLIPIVGSQANNNQVNSLSQEPPTSTSIKLDTAPVVLADNHTPITPVVNQTTRPDSDVKPVTEPIQAIDDVGSASLAALKDIEHQSNPSRKVFVKTAKKSVKINQDYLDLQIKSNHDGYLYLILLGSDKKSFYLLYPNKLDENNFIKAGQTIRIPNQAWQIKAAGPVGVDNILVMVSDSARDLSRLGDFGRDANSPFVYTLNDLKGRKALIDYLISPQKQGGSEKFAAQLIAIGEED